MSGLSGCETKDKVEIEQSFDKVLAIYPTPNLESFYDMEGYRDSEFDKDDKGVWVLNSDFSMSKTEEGELLTEGMLLRINRNTRKATGFYYIRKTSNDLSRPIEKEKYSVVYDENGFHLLEDLQGKDIKKRIENFKFFIQYGKFEKLDNYKNIRKMYNPEVPMYELEYQLTNEDPNVQALRNRYEIVTDKSPTLLLKGTGNLEENSVGYRQLEFRFDKKLSIYYTDVVDFQPSSLEDIIN